MAKEKNRPQREQIIKTSRERIETLKAKATQLNFQGVPADQHLSKEKREKLQKGKA